MCDVCINTSYTTNIIIVIIIGQAPPNHDSEFAVCLYTCIYIYIYICIYKYVLGAKYGFVQSMVKGNVAM